MQMAITVNRDMTMTILGEAVAICRIEALPNQMSGWLRHHG